MNASIAIKSKTDQVIDHVIAWLRSGEMKVGDKLPSERELAQLLGVSLLTINKAMARLEDLALVSRSAGRGTHVVQLPSPDAIAIIWDICHLANPNHSPFFDVLIELLQKTARNNGMVPHFLVGKGRTAPDFLSSLGIQSSVWNSIKGAIAMAWCEGVEDALAARGIPLVTISSKNQGNNSVIIDYGALGRMAASLFIAAPERDIYLVHNEVFDEIMWNNPILTFTEELTARHVSLDRVHFIPADTTREAGLAIGARLGRDNGHIFFTDENITVGFAEWLRHNTGSDDPGPDRMIITQVSGDSNLSIPDTFERLEFSMRAICREAVVLLEELLTHDLRRQESVRRYVKPVLYRRNEKSREKTLEDPAFSALNNSLYQV